LSCFVVAHLVIEGRLESLEDWNHQLIDNSVRVAAAALDETGHRNVRSLVQINACALEIFTRCVFEKASDDLLEERCEGVLSLFGRSGGLERHGELHDSLAALV